MVTIEIDNDVYEFIKNIAEPFVDTPNTVLRRILLQKGQTDKKIAVVYDSTNMNVGTGKTKVSSGAFMNTFLKSRYDEHFQTKTPYRTMFESDKRLIYFQNFNKFGTKNLWYRLREDSLKTLRETSKIATICFTNPSENLAIEIPMKDIDDQIAKKNWRQKFLEVNIDPANMRWRELDWKIDRYLIKYNNKVTS